MREDDNEIRLLQAEMARMEARFQALTENIQDVLLLISPAGTILYAGASTSVILGHDAETFFGRSMFDVIHPFDRQYMQDRWDQLLNNPGGTLTVLFRARHKNGIWLWFEGIGKNLVADPDVEAVVANFHVTSAPDGRD